MDLAPTLLYLLNQAVPETLDGRVLLEFIDDNFQRDRPVQRSSQSPVIPEEMNL